jgi:cytoskeletal protein RodZ
MENTTQGSSLSIGATLQKARLKAGISLEKMARETRIRLKYLQAIEDDNFAMLPSEVTAKGFVKICAETLGCDPATLLQQFGKPASAPVATPAKEAPVSDKKPFVVPKNFLLGMGISVAALLVALLIWQAIVWLPGWIENAMNSMGETASSNVTASADSVSKSAVLVNDYPEQNISDVASEPSTTPKPKIAKIKVRTTASAWLLVDVDGVESFHGVMNEGEERTWQGYSQITVRSPEAKAVHLVFNGREVGTLGYEYKTSQRKFTAEPME